MNKTIKTRLTKGADAHSTELVIDFTGTTQEQLEELAARSIIIATQAAYRTAESVPAKDTVVVSDMLKRERVSKSTPESVLAKIGKMSPEQQEEIKKLLLAQMKAGKSSK